MWVSVCGLSGVDQVLTFRHARGWHAESLPGVMLGLVTQEPDAIRGRIRGGSVRRHSAATALLTVGFALIRSRVAVPDVAALETEPITGVAETGIAGRDAL